MASALYARHPPPLVTPDGRKASAGTMEFEHKVGALDDEDLVVGEKEEKNWKGIVISLLVIGSILGAIIVAIILCTPDGDMDNNRMKLDYEHVVSDAWKIQGFNGSWLSDHEIVYVDQLGSIVIFDASTNTSTVMLVKKYDKTLHTMSKFWLSPDRQSILFVSEERRDFGAPISVSYALYNISSQTVEFIDDIVRAYAPQRVPNVQHARWAPHNNSILLVESGDIYLLPELGPTAAQRLVQLTSSGSESNSTMNGIPDSLYRTTIFSQQEGATVWWSGSGRYLAYLSFDDSAVEQTPIEHYDSYLSDDNNSPRIHYERYPFAGTPNPRVSVMVADLEAAGSGGSSPAALLQPPAELLRQQQFDPRYGHYVTYVCWLERTLKDDKPALLVMWLNRAQNVTILSQCELSENNNNNSWRCETLTTFSVRIPPSSDARRTIVSSYNSNGTRLIFFALPRPDSIIGDHYHVAMLRGDERAPKYLTHGEFDLDRLIGYDSGADALFFEVRVSENAERHLYRIDSVGQQAARHSKCLTCQLAEPCGYNYAHLAPGPNARFLVHECLGPGIPATRMRAISAGASSLESRLLLNTNAHLEQLARNKQMPIERYVKIRSNQGPGAYDVHVKLYLPNEVDDEKDKKFPLLVESSDLEQRSELRRYELGWGKYLASRKQVVYAKIDCVRARSSPGGPGGGHWSPAPGGVAGAPQQAPNGAAGRRQVARAVASSAEPAPFAGMLAEHEGGQFADSALFNAKDQVEVIRFMLDNSDLFPYIDRRRVAIWGPSSTASYVALASTLSDETRLISCTVAVSPITNWRYMSSFPAEHYLGLPWLEANNLLYERANLLKRGHEFSQRRLLIVHGTADEQVHVQHSMQFIKSLTDNQQSQFAHYHAQQQVSGAPAYQPVAAGFMHQMQLYPDVGHSLEQVKRHFYLTLDGFVDRCFYQKPIASKATEWKGKLRPKLY